MFDIFYQQKHCLSSIIEWLLLSISISLVSMAKFTFETIIPCISNVKGNVQTVCCVKKMQYYYKYYRLYVYKVIKNRQNNIIAKGGTI